MGLIYLTLLKDIDHLLDGRDAGNRFFGKRETKSYGADKATIDKADYAWDVEHITAV